MSLTVVESQKAPLTVDEVKAHAVIESPDDDEYLQGLIAVATGVAEHYTGTALLVTTYEYTLPAFQQKIPLPVFPVVSVSSVSYVDPDGAEQVSNDHYLKNDRFKPVLMPAYGASWPSTRPGYESVTITFIAGIAEWPEQLKHAISMIVSTLYENRSDDSDSNLYEVPLSSRSILDEFRVTHI